MTVYNKADIIFENENIQFPFISAKNGWGIENLILKIEEKISTSFTIIKKSYKNISKKQLENIIRNNCVIDYKRKNNETEVTFWVRKILPSI